MGKKGGGFFRGHKPVLSSSAGMFARKGDPWVTDKEGRRDFDRQVEIENPDMDADRQRAQRIQNFSKEFQDRVRSDFDFKMTMREAIETDKSVRMDSYHQREKAGQTLFRKKHGVKDWPKRGEDFQVATVQQRCANVAIRLKRELRALENGKTVGIISGEKGKREVISLPARVHDAETIACPYGCGYQTHDSRNVSKHLRKHRNKCCTHPNSCQCEDCKYSRNELA
jgi:hypothetical protein